MGINLEKAKEELEFLYRSSRKVDAVRSDHKAARQAYSILAKMIEEVVNLREEVANVEVQKPLQRVAPNGLPAHIQEAVQQSAQGAIKSPRATK